MSQMQEPTFQENKLKFINLLTDYGLETVLKENEIAIDFLNDVLKDKVPHKRYPLSVQRISRSKTPMYNAV